MAIPNDDFTGTDEITEYINSIKPGRKYRIHKVGSYKSNEGSIVIVAKGTMLTPEETTVFSQTFVLVQVHQQNQYCIRNDIQIEFQSTPPAPVAVVEEAKPVEPEVIPEPEPEPEVEEVVAAVVETPVVETPVPTPAPKAATPVVKPVAEPVKEKEEEVFTGSDWASRLRRGKAGEAAPQKQLVSGGAVPRQQPVAVREEKKRGSSPTRGGKGGPRPDRKDQFSIYVSMGTKDFKESDIDTLFGKFGKIVGKTLKCEKQFAFVDFADKKSVDAAIAGAGEDSMQFNGRAVRCQVRQDDKKAAPVGDKPRTAAAAAPRYAALYYL